MQACTEFELFKGVIEWAQPRGVSEGASDELSELLPLIRLPVMLPQELQVCNSLPSTSRSNLPCIRSNIALTKS